MLTKVLQLLGQLQREGHVIIDFYIGATWIDCCNTVDNDPQRIKAILEQKFRQVVSMVERCKMTYTKSTTFAEWLETI